MPTHVGHPKLSAIRILWAMKSVFVSLSLESLKDLSGCWRIKMRMLRHESCILLPRHGQVLLLGGCCEGRIMGTGTDPPNNPAYLELIWEGELFTDGWEWGRCWEMGLCYLSGCLEDTSGWGCVPGCVPGCGVPGCTHPVLLFSSLLTLVLSTFTLSYRKTETPNLLNNTFLYYLSATTFSASVALTPLGASCEWNYSIFVFWWLAFCFVLFFLQCHQGSFMLVHMSRAPFQGCIIFHCMCICHSSLLCKYPCMGSWLCSTFDCDENCTAVNTSVQIPLQDSVFGVLGCVAQRWIAGAHEGSLCDFWRISVPFSTSAFLHFRQWYLTVPVPPNHHQHTLFIFSFLFYGSHCWMHNSFEVLNFCMNMLSFLAPCGKMKKTFEYIF